MLLLALCGCTGNSQAAEPGTTWHSATPAASSDPATAGPPAAVPASSAPASSAPAANAASQQPGMLGMYPAGHAAVTLTRGHRSLYTEIWYPAVQQASTQFPMIVFAPGYMECGGAYAPLLRAWATAGYVVASVNSPVTSCKNGPQPNENDIVNQPADLSFVLSQLLGPRSGAIPVPVDPAEVAAAGQSDGGDTAAALASSSCCTDHRFGAVAVLSGQDWIYAAGMNFTGRGPAMLFTQGTADNENAPATSWHLYQTDRPGAKYYLRLLGADHLGPYTKVNQYENAVVRVSVAFFDHYLLHLPGTLGTLSRAGNVPGVDSLRAG